jgi:hypothetical protein
MGEQEKGAVEICGFAGSQLPSLTADAVVAFSTIPGLKDHVLVYPNLKGDFSLVDEHLTRDVNHSLDVCKRTMEEAGVTLVEMVNRKGRAYWVREEAVDHMPEGFAVKPAYYG